VTLDHHEGRHIAVDATHASNHRQTANVNELMNPQYAANHGTITDHHMTGHRNPIGDDNPITEAAIVA
jgi:hypothetical protein